MKRINFPEVIWVWLLFLSSGYLNALTLLLFSETAVGQTGRMTNMVYSFTQSDYSEAIQLLLLSIAFLTGAVISGTVFSRRNFDPRSKKLGGSLILIGIGLVVIDSVPGFSSLVMYYVCLVLGIQNSFYISYRGSSVSSTALTSVFSNFGAAMGAVIRGEKNSFPRVLYFSADILSHIAGAAICFVVSAWNQSYLMIAGMGLYLVAGVFFFIFRDNFTVEEDSIGEA